MTRDERAVTNPLTNEQIVGREFISELAGSSRLEVLRTLEGRVMTPSDIDCHGPIARQTASKHLTQFTDRGLTKPTAGECGYELTAGGKVIVDAFERCLQQVDRDALAHLSGSTHGLSLLRTLSEYPARPSELARNTPGSPSRPTVQRELQTFAGHDWSMEVDGHHQITHAGKRVLDAYDELGVTVEQVMEKAPWFQRLDPVHADVPVAALDGAKLYVSSPDSPGIVLAAALKLCDPRLDRFRVLTSIFNPTLFRAYDMLLKLGLEGEAIVDASLYERLHEEGMEHFLDDSDYDAFDIYRLEVPLTLGIGIYDEQQVAIGVYNEAGGGEHIAMVLSANDAIVEWGTGLFESLREEARPASEPDSETVSP
jgi:predicted transcriptional regulator